MATKWKNRLIIVVWSVFLAIGLSGVLSLFMHGSHYSYKNYFHSPNFQHEVDHFYYYLSVFELYDRPLEEAKEDLSVTVQEIEDHRYRFDGSQSDQIENTEILYEELIAEAGAQGNEDTVNALMAKKNRRIEEIKKFETDEYIKERLIIEKEERLENFYKEREQYRDQYLSLKDSFVYFFKNNNTGEVITNLEINEANEEIHSNDMFFIQRFTIDPGSIMSLDLTGEREFMNSLNLDEEGRFEGEIGIPKSIPLSDQFMKNYHEYKEEQITVLASVIAGIAAIIAFLFMNKKSKTVRNTLKKLNPYYQKLPVDLRVIIFLLTIAGAVLSMVFGVSNQLIFTLDSIVNAMELGIYFILGAFFSAISVLQGKLISRDLKDWQKVKGQWKEAFLYKSWGYLTERFHEVKEYLIEAYLNQTTGTQLFILLGFIFGIGVSAVLIFIHPAFILIYLVMLAGFGIPVVMILVKNIEYFNRIYEKTNEMARGNLGQDLEISDKSILAKLAGNINTLRQGVKISQSEQAKSERLKTELITNVSHDLRTPLTSIITYTELLKSENLASEDRVSYLEIIDSKSKRLKVLIDDLFEVSKMASGSIELKKDKVDLVQLIQQSLAEYEDIIQESSLQFRMTHAEKPIYAFVDGQKLWRVFSNLIGNILKYSLENSRVYISLSVQNDEAVITFKNISKYELNDNSDELYERFKRGDKSRHTDGSGLGLAIAKSIIDLHEGRLDIETDGDLFKVTIVLRKER